MNQLELPVIPYACVITLKSRPDRIKSFHAWAKDYGLNYDVFFAIKHPKGGYYGCWDSHMQIIRKALQLNVPFALIMEDDCVPNPHLKSAATQSLWNELKEFLGTHGDSFDMIGLGGTPLYYTTGLLKGKNPSKHIMKMPFSETHAYLISRKFMKLMALLPYEGTIDYQFARRCKNMYMFSPEIFVQDPKLGSDNESPIAKFLSVRETGKEILHFFARKWPVGVDGWKISMIYVVLVVASIISVIASGKYAYIAIPLAALAFGTIFHFIQYKYMDPYKFIIKSQTGKTSSVQQQKPQELSSMTCEDA